MAVKVIGLDTAKNVFQVHGADANGRAVLRKRLRRAQIPDFFANLPRCVVGIEATQGAHYWSRVIGSFGHEIRLIAPQFVKPYLTGQKNDTRDAAAICEAEGIAGRKLPDARSAGGNLVPGLGLDCKKGIEHDRGPAGDSRQACSDAHSKTGPTGHRQDRDQGNVRLSSGVCARRDYWRNSPRRGRSCGCSRGQGSGSQRSIDLYRDTGATRVETRFGEGPGEVLVIDRVEKPSAK